MVPVITNRMVHDILRKYLNSFSDSGFSGVSNGQNTAIDLATTIAKQSNTVSKPYKSDSLIMTKHANIERVDMISHLASVFA